MAHSDTDTITYAELRAAIADAGYGSGGLHADTLFDKAKDARRPQNITSDELRAALKKRMRDGYVTPYVSIEGNRDSRTVDGLADTLLADITAARAPKRELPPDGTVVRTPDGSFFKKFRAGWRLLTTDTSVDKPDSFLTDYKVV